MSVFLSFEDITQKQPLLNQIKLQHRRRLRDLVFHSSLEPPKEDKTTPIENSITEITAEAIDSSNEGLPETIGCTIAKTIIATAKFINPLPSSLRPLNQFI